MLVEALVLIAMLHRVLTMSIVSSTSNRMKLDRGYLTTAVVQKKLVANKSMIFNKICDYNSWSDWILPGSSFESNIIADRIIQSNQEIKELFGLWKSSSITWKVQEFVQDSSLVVTTSASQLTIAWDMLSMEFSISSDSILTLRYSWIISNPLVAVVEESVIRPSMMSDIEKSLDKLGHLLI